MISELRTLTENNYRPQLYQRVGGEIVLPAHDMFNDCDCSEEAYAEAILMGTWEEAEIEGVKTRVSRFGGRLYFLDLVASKGLRVW